MTRNATAAEATSAIFDQDLGWCLATRSEPFNEDIGGWEVDNVLR